jgi:DNA-binding response OmpR family regulator
MANKRILIIDDEVDYCIIMKSYFQDKGYDVTLAYNLQDGLTKLDTVSPTILFLDNNLPDGQGWDHVEKIVEKFPHLRVYLVSAYGYKTDFTNYSPNITVWEKPISFTSLNAVFAV